MVAARTGDTGGGGAYGVTLYDWMWRGDGGGLGLGHGADLVVYAALFGLTGGGAGVYDGPCSELARRLGYSRETVQRSLSRLLALDVVWSPGGRGSSSGTPRAYAISPGPLGRALGRDVAREGACPSEGAGGVGGPQAGTDCARGQGTLAGGRVDGACDDHAQDPQACGDPAQAEAGACGTSSQVSQTCDTSPQASRTCDPSSQDVPPARDAMSQAVIGTCDAPPQACDAPTRWACDDTGRAACDAASLPTSRHTPGEAARPAQMALFDAALVSPYTSSPDVPDADVAPRPLSPAERAAFEALVSRSLLPVDDAFLARDLEAFEALVASGVPADAVVEAYDDYAAYQHDRRRRTGEWRPMHLLRWLEMSPNGNIAYVMRRREAEASRATAAPARVGTSEGVPRQQPPAAPRRRGPRLTLCRDRGRAVWFVDDDHGSRRVEGAEGVEDPAEATRIYGLMYQRECRDAWRVA